ncbi:hypothetical protein H8S33_12705 [Ornithinibacillus sp. BX22]|uniref:Uncharacterized protein n=2 Tax=Ornithinibacillus TaxID=484508 RepID=A0A923RJ26_9BACI|nr:MULTISPECIES: hypothetical protein [Ornithinibacillus]MBC5637669.1 hypothetical protein [Ornithinibacillus hominis]MBS3681655.1 hypothetical protein [Ornithinibacillus massiliensis]
MDAINFFLIGITVVFVAERTEVSNRKQLYKLINLTTMLIVFVHTNSRLSNLE